MKSNLPQRVLKTIRNYDMIKPGDIVLAAVSGGPDSIFLLYILDNFKRKLGIRQIVVANLDHGLRGKESRDDSDFVKKYSAKLGLKFIHKKVKLKSRKRDGLSMEELARAERYKFFNEAAKRSGANVVATGHTLDDQAETVVMRLIKGASLKGMTGVSPVRNDLNLKVIRPLIELEKSEILHALDENSLDYRIDSSNVERVYFRNIVRHEIMPFLSKYNPKLKRVLFNLSEHLREDFDFISREKERVQRAIVRSSAQRVEISLKDIAIQPRALQKEILRDALEKCGGEVKKLSFRHWKEVESLIKYGRKGNCVDLPGSIRAHRTSDLLVFDRI